MKRVRNFWVYSVGLALAWAAVLTLTLALRGWEGFQLTLLVFLGYGLGWISVTIARYVYPPPRRWRSNPRRE